MSKLRTITPNEPADFTPSMGDYKTLQPFRYWCQKVLPLVYDDSLSYYELLCKVVDYLNKTMEDVETLHGDVTNLHTAYEELQSYVNNYFSTLDVQAEINNKLNEMSKDGVLSQLIEPFITENSNPIFVDNTSSMNDTTKIYVLTTNGHIYTYKNNNFVDTGMLYTFNNSDFILSHTELSITDEYLTNNPTVNVTNLSPNTFYRVDNITQEHALQLGLKEGMGVLGSIYITSPHSRTNTTQAYKLIEWNTGYRTNSRKYYAYMYGDDTVDTLTWHQIANNSNIDNVVNNTISCSFTHIDDSYLTANPNVNILTLDSNTFYRVDNLTNQHYDQLGFAPDMRGAGNLYITKPTLRSDAGYSYTLVEYTTGTLEYTKRFFTFLYGDETLSTVFWKRVADTNYLNDAPNTIIPNALFSITDKYLTSNPTVNVTNLSPNTFYRVENITQEHALQLGLKEGMGVLGSIYITSPHSRTNTTQAYKLIEWNTGYRTNSRKYYAYMYGDDTVDTLTWHQIANNSNIDNVVNNTISCSFTHIDDSYLTANPNVNILTLDSNTFYRVDNLTNQHYDQLGFAPDMRGAGNLYITKPTLRSDAGYSYTLVEYTTGNLEYTKRFFTFLYGNETLSTVFWKRVADTTLNRNINLARYNNVIYLIGDSIVEGYGGSNYNGGSSSNHSDEEIPNNVKKWYRNTTGTCWANMLKSYIESNYPNTTVINNGIGGLTCAQVDDNFDTLVGTDATMVIISCGTNDRDSSSKLSSITNHISNMVNKANRRGLKCVILTNSPLRESAGGKPNNAQTINAFINNSIANTNVNNIQILSNMLSYMELNDLSINDVTKDILHPNDQGYKIMFNIIRANLGM